MSETQGRYIDGNVNPFTGEPIKQVNSHDWNGATINELWDQLYVLNSRLNAVGQLGKIEYIAPLKLAIEQLQATIKQRSQSTEKLIT